MIVEDSYYCFNPVIIYYNLHIIIEKIILSITPEDKHQKNYYSKKGEYLEDKSIEIIEKILPNCTSYKNLKYNIDDEVDGLIIYDNNILIIESKSNKFTLGARRGNIEKIKTDTKNIVEKAYQQAIRTKQFILSNEISEFRDKNKKVVCKIKKKEINDIYLINVTLESLNHITTNLSSLKEFGFIQGDEWIWSVYLNDLRIISEILESPSEFLLYLERRLKFNDYPQISIAEEMDIFGYFLQTGLYFDDISFSDDSTFFINTFSKDIDNYFYFKDNVSPIKYEKPCLFYKDKNNIKYFVRNVEKTNIKNFTKLTKFLLSLDGSMQEFINKEIKLMQQGIRKDFHFIIEKLNYGIYFIPQNFMSEKIKNICELYAYFYKINNWFIIYINSNIVSRFEYIYYHNRYDILLENKVKELKKFRINQHKKSV